MPAQSLAALQAESPSRGRRVERSRALVAAVLSAAAHLALTGLVAWPDATRAAAPHAALQAPATRTEVELPIMFDGPASELGGAAFDDPGLRAVATPGGERQPRPDSGNAGRGGERQADAPAVNLAPRDDLAWLSPTLRSRLERSQLARLRGGVSRSSPEDDVVIRQPMMLTFVLDGVGKPDPRAAALRRTNAATLGRGGEQQRRHLFAEDGLRQRASSAARPGRLKPRAGRAGRASSGQARPQAPQGRDSGVADRRGPQGDTVNSEQEAHALNPSLLRASSAGGEAGGGRGGEAKGAAKPAAGGAAGDGFRSRPNGSGYGDGVVIDPADRRRRNYLRSVAGRIQRNWQARDFPMQAVLAGKQGYTIVSFVIARDGSVSAVRVTRRSGFPSFDQKMRQAVMRAAPFGPLPADLFPVLHHSHEFVVSNPAVLPPR